MLRRLTASRGGVPLPNAGRDIGIRLDRASIIRWLPPVVPMFDVGDIALIMNQARDIRIVIAFISTQMLSTVRLRHDDRKDQIVYRPLIRLIMFVSSQMTKLPKTAGFFQKIRLPSFTPPSG
jgi:hypothetical protein